MASFRPFSLSDAIQKSKNIELSDLKLNMMRSEVERKRNLKQMASESMRPTYEEQPVYGEAEGPPTREGQIPQIQTGTQQVQTGQEMDLGVMQQKAGAAGEMEMFAKLQEVRDKMAEGEREELDRTILDAGRTAFSADTPEKWAEAQYREEIPRDQGFDKREFAINAARKIEDMVKGVGGAASPFSKVSPKDYTPESIKMFEQTRRQSDLVPLGGADKAPKTRNVREGKYIVNQEWVPETNSWKEVGRGPMSEQQINLRNKPSEQAAGKEFNRILDQANTAEDQIVTINNAKALLPQIETGKLEPLQLWAKSWANEFGISINEESMVDSVSFRAVMKTAVLDGMKAIKGTASEADRKTVEDSVAALDNPEEANAFLLEVAESLARRKVEQANFWDQYAASNSSSLLGAKSAWSKRINDIPLIRNVGGKVHHYYKFKNQMLQANKAAFRDATQLEIDRRVDQEWTR